MEDRVELICGIHNLPLSQCNCTDEDKWKSIEEKLPKELRWDNEIKIEVHLRNKLNGDSRICIEEGYLNEDGDFFDFVWSEGNFSCDCNRSIFLYEGDSSKTMECHTENIIIDKIVRQDTGEILYEEHEKGGKQ